MEFQSSEGKVARSQARGDLNPTTKGNRRWLLIRESGARNLKQGLVQPKPEAVGRCGGRSPSLPRGTTT